MRSTTRRPIVQTGQTMSVTDNGTTRQVAFSAGLLSTVLNVDLRHPPPGEAFRRPTGRGLCGRQPTRHHRAARPFDELRHRHLTQTRECPRRSATLGPCISHAHVPSEQGTDVVDHRARRKRFTRLRAWRPSRTTPDHDRSAARTAVHQRHGNGCNLRPDTDRGELGLDGAGDQPWRPGRDPRRFGRRGRGRRCHQRPKSRRRTHHSPGRDGRPVWQPHPVHAQGRCE